MSELNEINEDMEVGVDTDDYEAPSEFFKPISSDTYELIRDAEQEIEWKTDKTGNIYCNAKFTVQGGDNDGRVIFSMLSTMVSKFRPSSTVQDFLAACGNDEPPANGRRYTVSEIKSLVAGTFGPFKAFVDWEIYCPECKKTFLKGARKFPRNADGEAEYKMACPDCGNNCGAKAVIKRYVVE